MQSQISNMKLKNNEKGFTLIELGCLVILGILATVVVVSVIQSFKSKS